MPCSPVVRTPLHCSASTAGGTSLIPGQETKILPALWCGPKKKKKASDSAPWDTEFSLETCSPFIILPTDHQSTLLSILFRRILISLLPVHLPHEPPPAVSSLSGEEKMALLGSGVLLAPNCSSGLKLKEPGCLRLCSTLCSPTKSHGFLHSEKWLLPLQTDFLRMKREERTYWRALGFPTRSCTWALC